MYMGAAMGTGLADPVPAVVRRGGHEGADGGGRRGRGVGHLQDARHRGHLRHRGAVPGRHRQADAVPGTDRVGQRLPGLRRLQRDRRRCSRSAGHHRSGFAELAGAAVLGVLAGGGARGFAWLVKAGQALAAATPPGRVGGPRRGATLAGLMVASRVVYGESLTLGSGYKVIAWIVQGDHALWAVALLLVLRAVATPATVAGGGAGGLFVPLVVLGALLGRCAARPCTSRPRPCSRSSGWPPSSGRGIARRWRRWCSSPNRPVDLASSCPGLIAAVVSQLVMGASRYRSTRALSEPATWRVASPYRLASAIQPDAATGQWTHHRGVRRRSPAGHSPHDGAGGGRSAPHRPAARRRPLPAWPDRLAHHHRRRSRDARSAPRPRSVGPSSKRSGSWTRCDRDMLGVVDDDGRFVGMVTTADLVRLDEILGHDRGGR